MNVTFVGGGNMASAMIGGMLKQGTSAREICVIEVAAQARERLAKQFQIAVHGAPEETVADAAVIVFAVKPQQLREAANALAPRLGSQLVISIAAGVRTPDLSRWLRGYARIIRAMPNTAALIGEGISGLYAAPGALSNDRATAEKLLRSVGETVWLDDEPALDAVTAVSGSGPAYVFYFIEALEKAAASLGLNGTAARMLAIRTFSGAAKMAALSSDEPAVLRQRVTSKGGTTERALAELARARVDEHFIEAVRAAAQRSRELGDEFGKPN